MRSRDVAQYISHNICHVCGTVWRSVCRVARVMALASEASTPCQLQPGTLAILKEANSCTIRQSLGGRYPGAPSSGVWCRVLPRRLARKHRHILKTEVPEACNLLTIPAQIGLSFLENEVWLLSVSLPRPSPPLIWWGTLVSHG